MKIKCEYCGSMFDDTLERCPSCNSPNQNVRRSTKDQPTTIAELQEWYKEKGLPPEETTRFFIGEDYKGPRAFGIYKDENSGKFIVYKNKSDGSRAVRYEGTDEAYAVNELHTRLKQEILEQKSRNIQNRSASSSGSRSTGRRRKVGTGKSLLIVLIIVAATVVGAFVVRSLNRYPDLGYYKYNDTLYYIHSYGWAEYDPERADWKESAYYPLNSSKRYKTKKYFLSADYDPSFGGKDFKDSILYDDYLNGFKVTQGYYTYDNNIYYHMKPDHNAGWYIYEDDDWSYVPSSSVPDDLYHQSIAQDFWFTPTWDSSTQYTDFESTEEYADYQKELASYSSSSDSSWDNDDDDYDYSWDSSDSWDSGSSDWDSDW